MALKTSVRQGQIKISRGNLLYAVFENRVNDIHGNVRKTFYVQFWLFGGLGDQGVLQIAYEMTSCNLQ